MKARSPTEELLRRHLRADSPRREAVICRGALVLIGMGLFSLIFVPGQAAIDRPAMVKALASAAIYEALILSYLRWGRYVPLIPWINAFIECTLVLVVLVAGSHHSGLLMAYSSPGLIPLGAMLAATSVRLRPALSIAAGLLCAAEICALQLALQAPGDPAIAGWHATSSRMILTVGAGVIGALAAKYFVRRASEALRDVREQDLMGKYLLHERLGAGGMAEVFRATYHPEGGFEKVVAIKRVLPALSRDPAFTRLFLEEARLCATLSHPNVVQVTDCGRFHDAFILAMEFVDGASLHRVLRDAHAKGRHLPLSVIAYVGAELAAALEYIHHRIGPDGAPLGLVHRDVNPANVLVSRFGEVKLADFGVTHAARSQEQPDAFYGKVQYAAPEQLRGGAIDARVDLFALGITLWELITGRRAYEGSEIEVLRAVLDDDLPLPSRHRSEVPPELDAVLAQLLARDRAKRTREASAVRARLLALQGDCAPYPTGAEQLGALVRGVAVEAPAPTTQTATELPSTSDLRGRTAAIGDRR